ncbi:MAG: cobalt ABC transporter permease [Pseudomonadota bacterium]
MRPWPFLAMLALALVFSAPAAAHKVIASVFVSGEVIEGEIGFSNGEMAADIPVEVFDHDGTKLGEVLTDGDGFFVFRPTARVTHVFRADLGAGHVAEVHLAADALPPSVGEVSAPGARAAPAPGAIAVPATPTAEGWSFGDTERAAIAEIVRNELRPLRREIAAYKEKNDLQTILGGIGYIVGIFGVGYFIAARRKLGKS